MTYLLLKLSALSVVAEVAIEWRLRRLGFGENFIAFILTICARLSTSVSMAGVLYVAVLVFVYG